MYSTSEENYIKCIYHLQEAGNNVSTNNIAAAIQTKPASVTDMLKKLEAKSLLHYQKYYGVKLSQDGLKLALSIIRRHRLWEFFLVAHLKFKWDEVHDIAEQLEHIKSEKLVEKLDVFMGYPKFDPHGDPIPDEKGKMKPQSQTSLLEAKLGLDYELCAVSDQSTAMLEMLGQKHLQIGTKISIKKRFPFDQSLELDAEQTTISVSEQLARHLFVKTIN
jgi:DtxR family Mn-dependent transcriptional regulator